MDPFSPFTRQADYGGYLKSQTPAGSVRYLYEPRPTPNGLIVSFGPELNVYNDGTVFHPYGRFHLHGARWQLDVEPYTAMTIANVSGVYLGIGPISAAAAGPRVTGYRVRITVTSRSGLAATTWVLGYRDTADWAHLWMNWLNAAGVAPIPTEENTQIYVM